jgi:SAM-dependent methyltransferase
MAVTRSAAYWNKASRSFDSASEAYDKFRPGYPEALVESLIELTGLASRANILEIGAGTGKATQYFARRGYSMLCLEPGANLAAVAARNLGAFPQVKFELCRFEDWQETPCRFDLVISAQAFHWVQKEIGFAKAARALKPSGWLALFWNMYPGMKGQIAIDLDKCYQEIAPDFGTPLDATDERIRQRAEEIDSSGFFGPVTINRFPWSLRYTTRQYQGLLNTYSDHLCLPAQTRRHLIEAIGQVIDRHGGVIDRPYETVLYVAQKLP